MQRYTLEERDGHVTIGIDRRGSSMFNTYLVISVGLFVCGYLIWRNPDQDVRSRLLAGVLFGVPLIYVAWQLWHLMQSDVWIFDRQTGSIAHNGRTLEPLPNLACLALERERDQWGNDPDCFTLYLVSHHGQRIKMVSGYDANVAWATNGEGHALEAMAQRMAKILGVEFVREGY